LLPQVKLGGLWMRLSGIVATGREKTRKPRFSPVPGLFSPGYEAGTEPEPIIMNFMSKSADDHTQYAPKEK
jgi:hypothetical protein